MVGLLAVFGVFAARAAASLPYGYDEADYVYAASQGLRANYLDSPSTPIAEFVRLGLEKGAHANQRATLSGHIRSRNDILFYRHWHGPLYYYWLSAMASRWQHEERVMRLATLVFGALTFLLLYVGLPWAIPGPIGRRARLLAAPVYLLGYANIRTAAMIGPHSLFALLSLAVVILLTKLSADSASARPPADGRGAGDQETATHRLPGRAKLRYWYAALVLTGLAAATLEVAFVLVAALAAVCWIERKRTFAGWPARAWFQFGARSAAALLATLMVVWPAALLKLSALKAYAFMAYLSVFRKAAWGEAGVIESWRLLLKSSAVEWLLVAAAAIFCIRRRKAPRAAVPALVFGALMLVSVLRVVSAEPRYVVMYLPALTVFAAVALASALAPVKTNVTYAVLGATLLLMVWNTNRQLRPIPAEAYDRAWAPVKLLRSQHLESARLLVPQGMVPVLHFYFPRAAFRGYVDDREIAAAAGQFDGVLVAEHGLRYVPIRGAGAGR